MTVIAAGEALIDLAPRDDQLLPLPGGSPYNVAVGLARLGVPTHFLGRISTDGFGRRLGARLSEEGVQLELVESTEDPTTLAVVHLDDQGRASYAFYLDGTSAASLHTVGRTLPAGAALHVSLGAIGLEHDAGQALDELIQVNAGRHVRSLDPNVRPSAITEVSAYAARVTTLVAACDLVKVSDEDLTVLFPGRDPLETAAAWARSGPALVVVTLGPDGAVGFGVSGSRVEVGGIDVEVVDTVGAGDAFTSGLLAWLDGHGELASRARLDALSDTDLRTALEQAVRAAALTCTRPGAAPPTVGELRRFGA